MQSDLKIRPMSRPEFDRLVDWAAAEGWNPGLHDAEVFWQTDPAAFVAAELDGELIGGGSIVSYDGRFGFMGFFIMRPEFRGRGLGSRLWHARRDRLRARLQPGAAIGMDGVFEMQPFYARGGFGFSHRDIRFQGEGVAADLSSGLVPVEQLPFAQLLAYDSAHFPAPRADFLRAWVAQADSRALAVPGERGLRGYGVIRRCREGAKIGPLFADDPATAEQLFAGLAAFAPGQPVFLDVPENNPDAMALARGHGMREVFGCAHMYLGPAPSLPWHETYGVTTFELG